MWVDLYMHEGSRETISLYGVAFMYEEIFQFMREHKNNL